jgi:hypothetical protein
MCASSEAQREEKKSAVTANPTQTEARGNNNIKNKKQNLDPRKQ